ncbi:heat shock 70 kDa protein 12B-like [Mercenaria mercenaria]|uniref:heat shock 70 kDa protein 12B-like n=1 Tax=Mercenaria mercenaria TaxID=6596 RepID=UPI00234EBF54|nr:heat shock 70 kDa protein 12B-like [Mercenaria mercenaria]XP_053409018.1 heat shock 70 kDa protein 12B-like [Mercenaria mercenaria]
MTDSHLLAVAFDFGTTYSGYAFSFRDNPLKIQTNQGWIAGSDQLISLKTPTCVLLNSKKEFDSFGFEAENKFASLAEDGQHHSWLLFRRFKMLLHSNETLSRTTTVEDINGKSMPAMTIFAMSIGYLKRHFLEALNKQKIGIEDSDIKYVLTVPAIWNDNAKQFMREAAEQAGIETKRLKLSFEPEAASIWCQTITTKAKESLSKSGNQYMIIDLGGGTADISVHEKQIDNTLKELHKASGGPWGGTVVDDNYLQWLKQIFGSATMQKFQEEQMEDYFQLHREFEIKKRSITPDSNGKITVRLSASLRELYQKNEKVQLDDKIASLGLKGMVTFTGDKLRVDASVIKGWFEAPINSVITHVQRVLKEPNMQRVDTILIVGGFGECKLAQDQIQKAIRNKCIIIPEGAGLAVLKGAVRYGHSPDIISSRIMPHTYGFSVLETFDEQTHYDATITFLDGEKYAEDVFSTIIRAGEGVTLGKIISKGPYTPTCQDNTTFNVYCTEKVDPKYTTDPGCKHLGRLRVSHSNGRCCKDNKLNASFIFGDTELLVKAVNLRTGEEFETYIDCL